ncbi:MAG TPA: ribonuclease J [Candidatus Dormibacteraeota bacterium]|nr:ribonuclease J [Candidatus Dormibacteraeota bacterium]
MTAVESAAEAGTGRLTIVPLGGLGEIGRNMLAVQYEDDIVVVDAGLMFPEQEMLGIDLVIPDINWLIERHGQVRAIVLTHGHEDHIGGLPYILPRLPVSVYGTGLTLGILRNKLREHRLLESTDLHTVRHGDTVQLGAMSVEFVRATHSIPDACALAIHTPLGVIIHSGDFKMDHTPINGQPPDLARLARLGDEGVLLLLSDSTNSESEGITPSERTVGEELSHIFESTDGRIIMATFASNISRLQQAMDCAEGCGRKAILVGRSMMNNAQVAQELGFLKVSSGQLVWPRQLDKLKDDELLVLCTGSQGEPLSALTRIASGEHPIIQLKSGDTVILSANPIPGNEELVHRTVNNLYRHGARVFHSSRHRVHASGHASREELKLLMTLTRPRYFVPVHGEYRHLAIHAELARSVGIPPENVVPIDNGTVVEVNEDGIHRTGRRAPAGYVYVDGLSIDEAGDVVLRDRRLLAQDGVVIVVLAVERSSGAVVAGPDLVSRGFIEDTGIDTLFEEAREDVLKAVGKLEPDAGWQVWQSAIHDSLGRFFYQRTRRRPMILPVVTEI